MKNNGVVHTVNDIKSILKNIKEEEDSCNEGNLTDDVYNGILIRLDLILKYVDDIYSIYELEEE